jgi:lipopolysaccharide exporter
MVGRRNDIDRPAGAAPLKIMAAARERLFGPSAILIGTTAIVNILRIGNTIVLSRLLSPRDFGLAGIILSIFFVVSMLTDAGFQAFIVRHQRSEEPQFLDAVWTVHVARGVLSAVIVALIAWPVGLIMAKPEVPLLLAVSGISLLVDALCSTSLFTVLREGRVSKLSIIDLMVFLCQVVVGICAAFVFRNVWAIVASTLVGSIARTTMSYVLFTNSVRRLRFDRDVFREIWSFSRVIAASSWLTLLIAQVDKLVLGRLFTLPQFGVYAVASNLAGAPTQIVYLYTSRIVYPTIANQWRLAPEGTRAAIYGGRGLVFYGYLFAVGGLVGGAALLIRLIYDPRYSGAAPYLSVLAISSALVMLTRAMGEALVATGETLTTLRMNIARIAWLVLGGIAGLALLGPMGLVLVLGLIELPAYVHGALVMRRLGLFDALLELFAFAVFGVGIALGMVVDVGASTLIGI